MGPVWETNHVWLIFVLVICWTAYPTAFASIMSTLAVPMFVAGIGIILRGTAYALRSGTASAREQRTVETVFGLSSILTPFALGAVIGGIASARVPVGNAEGDLVTSWLNPTSIFIGILAVATAAYLAAVYLAADAVRLGRTDLARAFRARALGTGVVAGTLALAGLGVVRDDARPIWDGLTSSAGLGAVVVSAAAGLVTVGLVWQSRFEPARATAALAVASIIGGWALAQRPRFLPGLSIEEAAAGRSTLIAVLVGVAVGSLVLIPALALLFGLKLHGRLGEPPVELRSAVVDLDARKTGRRSRLIPVAAGCLAVGAGLVFLFESSWAHVLGSFFLFAFIASGLIALAKSAAELEA
jgi:cytochrome d ubiquinol oxidase subunit II